jgi:hypothetical protein
MFTSNDILSLLTNEGIECMEHLLAIHFWPGICPPLNRNSESEQSFRKARSRAALVSVI